MLPSHKRLTRQQITDFLAYPGIKVVFNRLGTLKYTNSLENKGFTVVTGSKHQKKAVLRNKVRRQLYILFRQFSLQNKENTSITAMLYVSKQIYELSYDELKANFYALLQKTL